MPICLITASLIWFQNHTWTSEIEVDDIIKTNGRISIPEYTLTTMNVSDGQAHYYPVLANNAGIVLIIFLSRS